MAAIPFPLLQPSARSYSPGSFPQTEFRAQNGALTILRYGNKRVDSSLTLEFRNILDSEAALILTNYETVNKTLNNVTFTETTAAVTTSSDYANFLKESISGLKWRYAGPPQVSSVVRDRCNVTCEFVGTLLAS